MLPELFLERMQEMLGEEYTEFLSCYEEQRYQSLRINRLKKGAELLAREAGFLEAPVPWAEGGYYYNEETRPGRHPYHEAGLYYIQEASAMAPAAYLGAQPGERVLDLCAAPGGKSTQLAANMRGEGLLVCNEIHPARARILSGNMERMGIINALVLNHEPAVLAEHFPEYFDRILVDAPCSGEGMFRKNEEAAAQWSPENVQLCARRQDEILECAARCLKQGGYLMYSTCTFAPLEDEGTVSRFLSRHPEFTAEELELKGGMEPGNPAWGQKESAEPDSLAWGRTDMADQLAKTVRLWPHKLKGEGHFMALLKKAGERRKTIPVFENKELPLKECGAFAEFQKSSLQGIFKGKYLKFGEQLYLTPEDFPSLQGLKALRPGLHLGTFKKDRFEPAHALALALNEQDAARSLTLSVEDAEKYLKGYTFEAKGEKGWYLITVNGYSLGWGKLAGGIMKNHYPRGLRR